MIRQLITVLFASYMVCMAADDAGKGDNIGAILDQICAKRGSSSTSNRIEKPKPPVERDEEDDDDDTEDAEENKDNNLNLNQNASRKMYYAVDRGFFGDDSSEGSEENRNSNTNINFNSRHRSRLLFPHRRVNTDEPTRDSHRRMMNGLRRKLTRY